MIAKISQGKGFRGSLDYILRAESEPEIIGGNLSGTTPKELSREFGITRKLREDIEKPVYHISLTLPAGERLGNGTWEQITNDYLTKMGLDPDRHQHIIVRHRDTDHDHIHILTSRIDLQGQVFDAFRDRVKSKNICRELEADYKLTQVENEKKIYRAKTTQRERRMMERTGRTTEKVLVQEALTQLLDKENPISHRAFISALEAEGVIAIPNIASTGRISGYAFQLGGRNYSGSQVGYSWKYLQKLLQEPDQETVEYLKHRREVLQQGTPADAIRSIRNSVWEMGVRRTSFGEALQKQGWTLQGKSITKGEVSYKLADLVDVEKLTGSIWQLQQITAEARAQAQQKANKLSKGFYRPRRSFLAEMRPEDLLTAMVLVPEVVVFLLALSVVTEAVRAIRSHGTEAELKAQLQEIWVSSNDQVNRAVAEVRRGVVQNAGITTRTTGSDTTNSSGAEDDGGRSRSTDPGRGPDNEKMGAGPDSPAPGAGPDPRRAGGDSKNLSLAEADPGPDRPRGDADRYQSPDTQPQPAGGQYVDVSPTPDVQPVAVQEWAALAQDIAILGGDDVAKTEAVKAKERAWARQARILGEHVRYRVTCIPRGPDRDGKERFPWIPGQRGDVEIFYNPEEIKNMIPMLSRKNLEGHDIYITPITERYIHVMIDDLSTEAIQKMKADGLAPTAIWETSRGNHQAVFRLERSTPAHYRDPIKETESRAGAELVRRLTQEYGGDIKSAGIKKAFRLAGFSNKKPERNNEFVRVLETRKEECPRVRRLFTELTEKKLPEVVEEQKTERRAIIRGERGLTVPVGATASQDCLDAYIRETRRVEGLLRARGWTEDRSVVDYRVCEAMIRQGWARESVAYCLENLSERLAERHPDTGDYVQRTIRAAVRGATKAAPKVRRSRGGEPSL